MLRTADGHATDKADRTPTAKATAASLCDPLIVPSDDGRETALMRAPAPLTLGLTDTALLTPGGLIDAETARSADAMLREDPLAWIEPSPRPVRIIDNRCGERVSRRGLIRSHAP